MVGMMIVIVTSDYLSKKNQQKFKNTAPPSL